MNNPEYILKRIDEYFNRISSDAFDKCLNNIGCDYYPTSIQEFTNLLNIIQLSEVNFSGMTFLDVGCGVGNLCAVASLMGLNAEGIELNPVLYNIAKEIYPELKFHNVDIRSFNNYGDYDIIYYYAPLCNEDQQKTLKARVEDLSHVGAYIVTFGWKFEGIKDDRFLKIFSDETKNLRVWRKIK